MLTLANFLCVAAMNVAALVSSVCIVAGGVASTDALGEVPSALAFTGIPLMILRSLADYVPLWFRLWYAWKTAGFCQGTFAVFSETFIDELLTFFPLTFPLYPGAS